MSVNSRIVIAVVFVALSISVAAVAEDTSETLKPAAAEQKSAAPEQKAATEEPSVTVLGSRQAQSVLGKEVRSKANENMGRIVDVVVDHDGKVRAAVIDFGGFLGVGSRKIAVDWNALDFSADKTKHDVITLELTRDQVKAAPEYKDKATVVVLGASGGLQSLPTD